MSKVGKVSLISVVTVRRLSVRCEVRRQVGRQVHVVTEVEIRHGNHASSALIGRATLGGRWNSDQAEKEFIKNPSRFGANAKIKGPASDVAIMLGDSVVAQAWDLPGVVTSSEGMAMFLADPAEWERGNGWDMALEARLFSLPAPVAQAGAA